MSADMFKWRIAISQAGLTKGLFVRHGLPTPSQSQFRDHTIRKKQGDGGTAKHGYANAEILWMKLSPNQASDLKDIVDSITASGLLYMTIKPLDGSGIAFMDIYGKPELSDIAPDAPIVGADGYLHSNVMLTLNDAGILDTTPSF